MATLALHIAPAAAPTTTLLPSSLYYMHIYRKNTNERTNERTNRHTSIPQYSIQLELMLPYCRRSPVVFSIPVRFFFLQLIFDSIFIVILLFNSFAYIIVKLFFSPAHISIRINRSQCHTCTKNAAAD